MATVRTVTDNVPISVNDFLDIGVHWVEISNKHYVGETCRAFRMRMYEHKSSVSKDSKKSTPVSRHFSSDGHSQKHMQFSVLEWCTPKFESDNTSKRRRIELCWIFKLHSLSPIGINQFV